MLNTETGSSYFSSFVRSWQFWLACLSGLIYILGYFRALILFSVLDIYITPTEVYALSSLFTWGATSLLSALPMPIIAIIIGFILSKVHSFKAKWHYAVVALQVILLSILLYEILPKLAQYNPIGFLIVPSSWIYLSWSVNSMAYRIWTTIILALICSTFFVFERLKKNHLLLLITLLFLSWVFLLTFSQYHDFSHVTGGASINPLSQYPGMNGLLITNSRVSFWGSHLPEYGETAYGMWGLLLSRREGEYYFVPWIVANRFTSESVESEIANQYGEIVIIPEKNVISFLKRFPASYDFVGLESPFEPEK
jgi:hypothetical protein